MLAIDEAKLPPPMPASSAAISAVENDTPGLSTNPANVHGTSNISTLKIVQLRPPNRATANVYGNRSMEPAAAGTAVRRNFCDG